VVYKLKKYPHHFAKEKYHKKFIIFRVFTFFPFDLNLGH
jgi:hypothetical protein